MVACLYEDNKNYFDVDKSNSLDHCFKSFILAHTKGKNFDGTLAEHCIFDHDYGKEGVWFKTDVHIYHQHEHFREQEHTQQKPDIVSQPHGL